jgi:2-polyprenyl-6-hydroxyphenyl methylase / 3-demethylubiquinone-9 3-methyltransferase
MAPRGAARTWSQSDSAADLALSANLSTYEDLDERQYVEGAPHLKHISIGGIYRALVIEAIRAIGRDHSDISVLDVGAGNGLASIPWLRRNVRLTAVDSSEPMLQAFRRRAGAYGVNPQTITGDALEYLRSTPQKFDIVTHVSMLHHIPDYAELLLASCARVRPGGCLITFQDPLHYERMPRWHHIADRASYFAWRLSQGNYRRGLKTRWRRLRGVYSATETVDFDEYHVVRRGVDSELIVDLLREHFPHVKVVRYWSTYSPLLQLAGERVGISSSFGVLASGRKDNGQPERP